MSESIRIMGNETEWDREFNDDFISAIHSGYIEIGPDNIYLPIYFNEVYQKIKKFQVRQDDVFIAAFPKTGSRWTEEMVWQIMHNLDYQRGNEMPLYQRCPKLELEGMRLSFSNEIKSIDDIAAMTSPRCIGTHLHWSLLPNDIVNKVKQPKIIVVLRSAEDVCLSYYHQLVQLIEYKKDFDHYCKMFLSGRVPFGDYWKHNLAFWKQQPQPNILFVKYKKMKENLPSVIEEVANFLGKILSREDVLKLSEHLSFDSLKKNKSFNMEVVATAYKCTLNPFVRSGKVGGYKSEMSSELVKKFKEKTENNLKGTGLTLD